MSNETEILRPSRAAIWIGRVLGALPVIMLLLSALHETGPHGNGGRRVPKAGVRDRR